MIARKRERFTLSQGAIIMNSKGIRKSEQIQLIMEGRRSGLSDYQWCQNHGINPGTFYNWVSKLCKAGYELYDSESRTSALPSKQEVVMNNPVSVPEYSFILLNR